MAVAFACLLTHCSSLGHGVLIHLQGPTPESDEREVAPILAGEGVREENPGLPPGAAVTIRALNGFSAG